MDINWQEISVGLASDFFSNDTDNRESCLRNLHMSIDAKRHTIKEPGYL
jgi:hypothetical protein